MEFGSSFGVCLIVSLTLRSSTWAVAHLKANGISTNALIVAGKVLKSDLGLLPNFKNLYLSVCPGV